MRGIFILIRKYFALLKIKTISNLKMKIGIYGRASTKEISEEIIEKAKVIGKEIAKLDWTIITGACWEIPYEAVSAAKKYDKNAKCIGFSPAPNLEMHEEWKMPTEGFTKINFVPEELFYSIKEEKRKAVGLKLRNVLSVTETDAAIFINGQIGSMNEYTTAYDMGKVIGVLTGTGGITNGPIQALNDITTKKTEAEIIFESEPVNLIQKIYTCLERRKNSN